MLVSLELDEVMNLSDRILVMYEGEIVGEFDPKTTTVQELGLYMACLLYTSLANYIDVDAIHWLRFPGGSTNTVSHRYGGRQIMQQLKAQAEQKGYAWIDWNVCAEDATASHPNAAQILRNVQNDAKDQPICVVLMHDTNATHETVKALPDILEWFAAKGYRFFTVQQMAE